MMKYAFVLSAGLIAANIQPVQALHYDGPVLDTSARLPLCKEYEVYSYDPYASNISGIVSLKRCETGMVVTISCKDVNELYQNIRHLDDEFAVATARGLKVALHERCPPLTIQLQEFRLGGYGASR